MIWRLKLRKGFKPVRGQSSYEKGLSAEQIAADHLRGLGYDILEMRYKTKAGEIDVIAQDGNCLVAVEVKFRADLTQALEAITPRSRRRIENAFLTYISKNYPAMDQAMRFDVIAIIPPLSVHHLENAWLAGA